MRSRIKTHFRLWISLSFYWLLTIVGLMAALDKVKGHFGYPLDDTYIHMAMAKHFSVNGFWGVTQSGFSSSTSSPLWTLLIAATYEAFGVNDWSPFILSLLVGSLIILYCYRLLSANKYSAGMLAVLAILVFVPLPILTLTGMEHILHGFLSLALVYNAANYLPQNKFILHSYALLIVLANLTTVTRYEGLLLVGSIALVFLMRKRFLEGILFGITGLLSIIVYGLISLARGWYFLPNSVLLKGNTPSLTLEGITVLGWRAIENFANSPHIVVLLAGCLISYLWLKTQLGEKERISINLITMTTIAHILFASIGWFFRYEAYLVLVLSVVLADVVNKHIAPHLSNLTNENLYGCAVAIALLFLFLFPLGGRALFAFNQYPTAVKNIYEQQYQMGLFIKEYYSGKCIAANDIGAINYLTDVCVIDLFGLASLEVARYKFSRSYDKHAIAQLVSDYNVQVIIIYEDWFSGQIPEDWVEVGKWKISNNVVTGSDEVSFYAPTSALRQTLIDHLNEFSYRLPSRVSQSGMYLPP